jgi:hypothetical protein
VQTLSSWFVGNLASHAGFVFVKETQSIVLFNESHRGFLSLNVGRVGPGLSNSLLRQAIAVLFVRGGDGTEVALSSAAANSSL